MQPWFIPMIYVSGAVLAGLALPRIRTRLLSAYALDISVSSAQAYAFGRGVRDDGADWVLFSPWPS